MADLVFVDEQPGFGHAYRHYGDGRESRSCLTDSILHFPIPP